MSSIQLNPLSSSSIEVPTDSNAGSRQASKYSSSDLGSRHQVSSLPIMNTNDQSRDTTLWEHFVANKDVLWLLKATCNYWPKSDGCACDWNLLHKCCFVVAWLSIMASAMVALVYLIVSLAFGYGEIDIVVNLAMLLCCFAVLPSQYFNHQRLQQQFTIHDSLGLDWCVRITTRFGAISASTVVLSLILFSFSDLTKPYFMVIGAEIFIVMYLTFNMFFLMMDVKASLILLDQLHLLADDRSLTLAKFNFARDEIHRRVDVSRWTSDLILIPSLTSMICFVILIVALDHGEDYAFFMAIMGELVSLLKELLFIAFAFYFVSQVNERADALTVKLSNTEWTTDAESISVIDIRRLSVHATSVSRPITFTILFQRLSRQYVAISAAGFGLTVLISVIRYLVGY